MNLLKKYHINRLYYIEYREKLGGQLGPGLKLENTLHQADKVFRDGNGKLSSS